MAKHQVRREMMGQLVHGCRREPVTCVQAAQEAGGEKYCAVVVNRGVAEISGDLVSTVF
jgi:hypothetical protein